MAKKNKNILFFLGTTIIILWQMLKPGYILTLDMIFAPKIKFLFTANDFYNFLPGYLLLKLFNLFLEGWVIQKIILIALFFCLSYLAFKYLPVTKKYYLNYWAAIFYTINPFVYERFLAGQWPHLFAYAFLPPFIYYLFKFRQKPTWLNISWLFGWLFLIGIFSLHFLVIASITLIIYLVYYFIKNLIRHKKKLAKNLLLISLTAILIFLILNSYWLIPYFINQDQIIINDFTSENLQAFKTSTDSKIGTSLNVLALYGFWAEKEPWSQYWLWPKDNFIFWSILAILFLIIIITGLILGLKNKKERSISIFFLILGFIAFILSAGISQTIFKNFNQWLFDNIYFWSGFRDTYKFSSLLVLSYVYFASLGIAWIMDLFSKTKFKKIIFYILFLITILYTYPILGGFARQLQPVWYPQSWHQVNQILNQDENEFIVLFLPWHQYLSLNFNNKLIIANPAKIFFDKSIIQGKNMELNNIFSQNNDQEYLQFENLIINQNNLSNNKIIEKLVKKNVKYIIFAKDLKYIDFLKYSFLESEKLKIIHDSPEIILYKINDF